MPQRESLPSRLASYYKTFAVILLNCVLLLVLINLLVKAGVDVKESFRKQKSEESTPWNYKKYSPVLDSVHPGLSPDQIDQVIRENRKLQKEYEAYVQHRERPTSGAFVNVTHEGYRPVKDQGPWPPSKDDFVVFVFGGSTTFGYGVQDTKTIASHLQDILRSQVNPAARVYNFGRTGYIAIQETILLEKLIVWGNVPNMAVFLDGLNEFNQYEGVPGHTRELKMLMDRGQLSLETMFFERLPITRLFLEMTGKMPGAAANDGQIDKAVQRNAYDKVIADVISRYRANKRITDAMGKEFGLIPVFAWQPVPVYKHNKETCVFAKFDYDRYVPLLVDAYPKVDASFQANSPGKNFIWLADMQQDLKKPIYVDAFHYSGEMCRMIAQRIVDGIRERELMPPAVAQGRADGSVRVESQAQQQ